MFKIKNKLQSPLTSNDFIFPVFNQVNHKEVQDNHKDINEENNNTIEEKLNENKGPAINLEISYRKPIPTSKRGKR